jgi:uncharacterized protein Usg
MKTTLTKDQSETFKKDTENGWIKATVRHDDNCGNGHNTFSITAHICEKHPTAPNSHSYGCQHGEIVEHFPELAPLIKWHLCSTDGPLHYIANTVYHATAYPEFWPIGQKAWVDVSKGGRWSVFKIASGKELASYVARIAKAGFNPYTTEETPGDMRFRVRPYKNTMHKEADLGAARSSAVWPDATIDQLRSEEELSARLPSLLGEFKGAVESLGFIY